MPLYEFQSARGKVIERSFAMSRVPRTITVGKVRYRRIISRSTEVMSNFKPYASISAPKRVPGFPTDERGRVILESRAKEKELAQKTGLVWE